MPVCATASAIVEVLSFAASYWMVRRWLRTSAFSASSPLSFEDRHFLVAIHAFDLEDRLGVDLADFAGGHLPALFRHVPEPLLEEIEDVLVVERVVDAAPFTARADDAHAAHQAKLMRHRGFANPNVLGNLVDAELTRRQGVDDADAGGIAKDSECVRERLDEGVVPAERGGRSLHI